MSLKKRVPIPINMVIRSIMNIIRIINQNNLEHNLSGEIMK